jgi:hypothetical protein
MMGQFCFHADTARVGGRECDPAVNLSAYYASPEVRARIAEYCGDSWDIAGYGGRRRLYETNGAPVAVPYREADALLEDGADVCRSLADRNGAVLQLDVDYANPRDHAEPYRDPAACFARLETVYGAVQAVFARYGLRALTVMTGRGYHFTLRAPRGSPFLSELIATGSPPASLVARYRAIDPPEEAVAMGRAHDGAGRLLEHLAHEVVRLLGRGTPLAVTLADVAPPGDAPFVCLDLTAYADPVFERYARCAFSANQKASLTGVAPERPFVIDLPRNEDDRLDDLLRDREDLRRSAARAARARCRLPDVERATAWVEEYRRSRLAAFHRDFDAGPEIPREGWAFTYDRLDLRTLPDCARRPLESPNPALLTPVHLRTVALALWGLGWHPRSVSALVRSRYEKDCGWGDLWRRYDPAARAEFYVRLFCGAVADGLEDPEGFSCASQAARGVCPAQGCGWDLARLMESVGAS